MRSRKYLIIIALTLALPSIAVSNDAIPVNIVYTEDTFGHLLAKQLTLLDSEIEAKIRVSKSQGISPNQNSVNLPPNAQPLPNAKQDFSSKEPVLEAIWGVVGQEVAELNYLGVPLPVSMQDPYISRIDGWKLESITPYSITLIKLSGKKVNQRKTITLDWRRPASTDNSLPTTAFSVQ